MDCIKIYALVLLVTTVWATPIVIESQSPELLHHAILDTNDLVQLRWAYNSSYAVFQLQVQSTSGWIGVGISSTGSMAGSDLAVMWMEEGVPKLLDMHADANTLPHLDDSQDLDLISAEVSDGKTTFTFGRKLETCDEDDNDISENTLRILWAYDSVLPTGGELNPYNKHAAENRGSRSLRILSYQQTSEPNDNGLTTVELLNNNVTIPNKVTYYHCQIRKLELEGKKKHVVKFSPVIEPGNEMFVHHMLVYLCAGFSDFTEDDGHECFTANMPSEYWKCRTLISAWAIGGGELVLPDDVGLPLDGSKGDIYLQTEMHYDNPNKETGRTDSSGYSVTFTEYLREKEAGILQIGEHVSDMQFIPPGASAWKTFSECSSSCLESAITNEQESVKVFAVFLHSHIFGRQLVLRHYRNGVELKPLATDINYDFNYQEYSFLSNEVELKKGDNIAMECVYDTTSQTTPVYGGLGTTEEMCIAFVFTYPRLDIQDCWATKDIAAVSEHLGLDSSLIYTNYDEWKQQYIDTTTNTAFDAEELNQKYLNTVDYFQACGEGFHFKRESRSVNTPYVEPDKCAADGTMEPVTSPEMEITTSSAFRFSPSIVILLLIYFAYYIK